MNARLFAAALIATATLACAPAFAQTQVADAGQPSASQGLTRAQVREELRQARASGRLDQSLDTYPSLLQQRTSVGRSRADVRSEIGTAVDANDGRA
ncbi:DUF4148 domain-containing protein [Pandoraea nosoerga]|uniref:DUF4148 domain-containing protein n=1 Tax=Pandoraea nosoerga TaxID=2508296 RepID=A0A5E4TI14_9BURK|nr:MULTISPECIES: DUF4148 domain-containing protein [Pandoraea]MBN4665459.1 DUF4148 domain-containing protein [Pandoraea nosoerga]MBN4674984.1 DUF4148 domain-containing protein [Pandoraea nosoerga]MBN4680300.1 DUF4148 domain-containing protein [Pandoraea nosoerga]MBN4744467.1 DUF4148 domain-containing protein [Pandoraea nosoerga]VVD86693.1 hypothetical protein PNO31109_01384 [Pandoraea nosoerga]